MSSTMLLATPEFSNHLVVECDASRFKIAIMLMQEGQPIPFEYRKLNQRECLKPTYDNEMLIIIHDISKWCQYLLRAKFMIHNDHNQC